MITFRPILIFLTGLVVVMSSVIYYDQVIKLNSPQINNHPAVRVVQNENGLIISHKEFDYLFSMNGPGVEFHHGKLSWHWSNSETYPNKPYYSAESNSIIYDHAGWREEYLIKSNSIEQIFVIDELPNLSSGQSLKISGQIQSDGKFKASKSGWTWSGFSSVVSLGNVFAFDANGTEIVASMDVNPAGTSIDIDYDNLKDAVFPITIDPEIGASDLRISHMGSDGDAANYSGSNSAIAFCPTSDPTTYPGGIYLVVWEGSVTGEIEIYGQFVDGDTRALLDANPDPGRTDIKISDTNGSSSASYDALSPSIIASDTAFLVVWYANEGGDGFGDFEYEIWGQFMDPDTLQKTNDPFRISYMGTDDSDLYGAFEPDVAYNSTSGRYMVVWYGDDTDNEFEIFSQQVNSDGTLYGSPTLISELGSSSYIALSPSITWNSNPSTNEFIVVWYGDHPYAADNEYEIWAHRLDGSTGNELGFDQQISDLGNDGNTAFSANNPSVVHNENDNNYLVIYHGDSITVGENEIFVHFITSSTGVSSGDDIRISDMGPDGNVNFDGANAKVAYDPNLVKFFTVWSGDDNSGGLVNGENEIFGQVLEISGDEDTSNDFRISDAGGTGSATYSASSPAIAYNPIYREYLITWHGDDDWTTTIDNEIEVWGQFYALLDEEPSNQATSFSVSSITSSSFTTSFAAATGSPDGYVVLRKTGSSPTDTPEDNTEYVVDEIIGSSTVVHVGSDLTFDESGLSANTTYYYDIFSFNGVNSSTNYFTTSPLEGNVTTLASEPTTQTSSLVFSGVETGEVTIDFTDGDGDSRLVVAKEGSAVDVFPVDGNSYTENNVFGSGDDLGSSNYVVGAGSGPITVTGLSTFTTYYFRVFEFNGSGGLENYNVSAATANPNSVGTLSAEPSNQPTGLTLGSLTDVSLSGSFTAATGTPNGYIVLGKEGSAPTSTPADGTSYSAGNTLGDAVIVSTGSESSFDDTGLSPATDYYYAVFSFNGSGSTINYLETTPLEGNTTTYEAEPSTQASSLIFSTLETTSITVDFTDGDGTSRLLVMKEGSVVDQTPSDGSSYTANAVFGNGADLGASNFIVGIGSGPVSVTGLSEATLYHLKVFEFNGSGGLENYNLDDVSGNPASISTLTNEPVGQPTSLNFDVIAESSVSLSFMAGAGTPDGYLILMRSGAAPTGIPADGTEYVAGNPIGDGTVVYASTGTSFDVTSLSAATEYYFAIFSYNGAGPNINYLADLPLEGSVFTLADQPVAQATSLEFSSVTPSSMAASFTAATGTPDGYLVLRKAVSAPGEMPENGTVYAVDDNLGSSTIAFVGSSVTFTNESLDPDTEYFYTVYAYNGTGVSTHYLTAVPLTGSQTTLANEPSASPTSLLLDGITTTSMNGSFTATAADGYLVLRRLSSSPTETPVDGTSYSPDEVLGTSTVIHVGSTTTFSSTGLEAGRVYFYDVFGYNGSGSSLNYKATDPLESSAITISPAPVLQDPTQIASSSFSASWNASTGAASYQLDVSVDNFTTYVEGYEALVVTGGLEESVTGLTPETAYKYRVRAVNASGVSANSLEKSVTTLEESGTVDTDPPIITNPSGEFGETISATVTDGGSGVATAMLYYKPISGTDFEFIEMTDGSGNTYSVNTEEAWADELGMEGYIIAEDAVGNITESPVHFFLYRPVPQDATIPFAGASFDGKTSTYRMFSIPYDLGNNNLLSDVFSEALGEQNQVTWRVFHYNGQTEYLELSTSSRIDLGNAYWFNTVRKDFTINIDEGTAVGSNQDNPFTKSFRQGWNQIGNPYPFEISWDAIQAANPDRVLGSAHGFSNGSYQTTNTLAPWEGVFVFCETAGTVSYPISSKAAARTVVESDENFAWKLDMKLTLGVQTQVSSVGMSEEALDGKDRLDEIAVPRFISYLEMTTHHPEFFAPHFTSDIVPLANGYEWTFEMASDKTSGQANISWDAEKLLAIEGTCFLVDQTTLEVIDMRMNSSYAFDWENGKKFKVVYARDGKLTTSANQIGGVYPNPFNRELSIPLMVAHKKEHLDIWIVNVSGQMVFREIKAFEHGGKQQYQWSGHDQRGHELPDGLYIIQLEWPDVSKTIRVIKSSKL